MTEQKGASPYKNMITGVWFCAALYSTYTLIMKSYDIRLIAINKFGPIIHEFDPYFNLRATEYLYAHGWKAFVEWFDYQSWYPLGRPVGTTIYPGMQVTAVWIKNWIVGDKMSLNDVCCYVPAWFGALATFFTGVLAYECSLPRNSDEEGEDKPYGSIFEHIPLVNLAYSKLVLPILRACIDVLESVFKTDFGMRQLSRKRCVVDLSSPALECGIFAAAIMAIIPAHIMRSVGGGFDNESIAMAAMTLTFALWVRSLRGGKMNGTSAVSPFIWGTITGLAYFYMVAAWGGYVFVINLIGCHAGVLVLLGRFSTKLHRAYSAFYIVGTSLAIQVPVVGWAPIKSLEQLGPLAVFVGFQLLEFAEREKRKRGLTKIQLWKLRVYIFAAAGVVGGVIVYFLAPTGYFGPISSRVRGLFVKHTKTGNPLVDSVAEHQPASPEAYKQYLGKIMQVSVVGFAFVLLRFFHDASSFLVVFGVVTFFLSNKMVRLILLTAPIASVLSGIVLGRLFSFCFYNIVGFLPSVLNVKEIDSIQLKTDESGKNKKSKKGKDKSNSVKESDDKTVSKVIVAAMLFYIVKQMIPEVQEFVKFSHGMAHSMSHPTIIFEGTLKDGTNVKVDDYRDAYFWLKHNTPEDSRVMAWWDYGYQITGIANRTTIADGNTWNHEHIALLARTLTTSEKEGHRIARHLADYVLVWAGGGGDDLAKSPHIVRIANSVYRQMCPGDPTCSSFSRGRDGRPSPMMAESLLFKLHSAGMHEGVEVDPNRFKEVFRTKYGRVRIFKILSVSEASKKWVSNNRVCDAPGSWYCRGQYPPALEKVLSEKQDFAQLEDFNKKTDDTEYQKQYFENLNPDKTNRNRDAAPKKPVDTRKEWKPKKVKKDEIEKISKNWEDTPSTTMLWQMINDDDVTGMMELLLESPELAFVRSSDGRGPMWWAHEKRNTKIIRVLKKVGASEIAQDGQGITPLALSTKSEL